MRDASADTFFMKKPPGTAMFSGCNTLFVIYFIISQRKRKINIEYYTIFFVFWGLIFARKIIDKPMFSDYNGIKLNTKNMVFSQKWTGLL